MREKLNKQSDGPARRDRRALDPSPGVFLLSAGWGAAAATSYPPRRHRRRTTPTATLPGCGSRYDPTPPVASLPGSTPTTTATPTVSTPIPLSPPASCSPRSKSAYDSGKTVVLFCPRRRNRRPARDHHGSHPSPRPRRPRGLHSPGQAGRPLRSDHAGRQPRAPVPALVVVRPQRAQRRYSAGFRRAMASRAPRRSGWPCATLPTTGPGSTYQPN